MFSNNDILNDEHVIKFINSRNLKPNSISVYRISLKNYCNYTGLTPTQLINEADEEYDNGVKKKNRKIKSYLQGFINHLDNEGRAANTIHNSFINIRSFYDEFEVELPKVKCKIKDEEELITIKDIPEKHIKRALKYANLCYIAIIKLMMSSGMGSSEIRSLTLKDYIDAQGIRKYNISNFEDTIKKLQEKEKETPTWSIRRIKTGMPYVTFSSPEANMAIIEYLEDRNERMPIQDINDFLFVSKNHKKIIARSFAQYFQRLNDSAVKVLGDEILREIAIVLVRTVRDNITIDWTLRENVQAKLRVAVKRILRKYDYPPDKQKKAVETVLEQANLICKNLAEI